MIKMTSSLKYYCLTFFIITLIGNVASSDDCKDSESSLLCHGTRVVRNVMKSLQDSSTPLTIVPGLEIVSVPTPEKPMGDFDGRSNDIDDDTFSGRVSNYMQNHELKIKFSDLLEKAEFKDALMTTLRSIDDSKDVAAEGRKKDKGGLGIIMMMGLMMGKMMAALGLGGVGALAMKALGVSMMALMLAGIVGIKKLAESGNDDGGHHVQYITAHDGHHRKRRDAEDDIPLPYRGWTHYAGN